MPARSRARKRALDILFEAEQRRVPVLELLSERQSLGEQPVPEYAAVLVRGVAAHQDQIDTLIAQNAVDWTLERMPAVDRNILRLGTYEVLWADDVPDGVAISEAVLLAQDLSTDASPAFVNGLLARIEELKPTLALLALLAPACPPLASGPPARAVFPRRAEAWCGITLRSGGAGPGGGALRGTTPRRWPRRRASGRW
jgi:transcription antitermination protein NusB